jgi:hypothetical protein
MAEEQQPPKALPLQGFRIIPTPDSPKIAIIEIVTREGKFYFAARKKQLQRLAEGFQKVADSLPD